MRRTPSCVIAGSKSLQIPARRVYKLTPQTDDEDDAVVGFEFEVAEDAKAALQGVDRGIVAYDETSKINKTAGKRVASYVFITEDATSADLEVAKVDKVKERAGIGYVQIDGEWEEVDYENKKSIVEDYADLEDLDKGFIVFSRTEKEKLVIKGVLETTDLAGASIVTAVDGSIVKLEGGVLGGEAPEGKIDLEKKEDDINKQYEDYAIVHVDASVDKDGYVEFDDGEQLGVGLPAGKFVKGDRVYVDKALEVIYIVTVEGVDEKDVIEEDGYVIYEEDVEEEPAADDDEPIEEPSGEEPTTEPSGEEPTTEPSGEEPTTEPSGEEPTTEPSGEEPTTEPSGESGERV